METTPIFEKLKSDMNKTIEHTLNEFNNLHTGKASPAMLDAVKVNAYGSTLSLKECAAVTTPDAKTIVVQPWDKSISGEIEKAIQNANLGLNPIACATGSKRHISGHCLSFIILYFFAKSSFSSKDNGSCGGTIL